MDLELHISNQIDRLQKNMNDNILCVIECLSKIDERIRDINRKLDNLEKDINKNYDTRTI